MGKETPYFGDLDISTKNPDNSSIIGGIIITLFFSFICVSIGMIGFLTYIFDDITRVRFSNSHVALQEHPARFACLS